MRVFIDSYGCSANNNNAEIMAGLLSRAGHIVVNSEDLADVVILNTCVVKGPTEDRMKSRIRGCRKPLIVSGCMAELEYGILDGLSLVGPGHIKEIVRAVEETSQGNVVNAVGKSFEIKLSLPKVPRNRLVSVIQISEGCLGDCSYCITRLAKGRLRSYPKDKIVKEIEASVRNRCREIWLTSQDNGCYGFDIGTDIIELLEDALKIRGRFRVRLGMSNPDHVLDLADDLVRLYKDDNIFKFLHIPVQSGSDKVLKDMGRRYSVQDFRIIADKFRRGLDDVSISTDVIIGYPTETEEDFRLTLDLIKEVRPDVLNVSRFWPRPGTRASGLKQLPRDVVDSRSRRLNEEFLKISEEKNRTFIGKEMEVLVSDGKKGNWIARTDSYRQVIIGSDDDVLGKFVKVRITDAGRHDLKASLIK